MKRGLNPHEARLVAGILEDPKYDDDFSAYEMAADIIRAVNERREREKLWVVAAQPEGRPATIIGPFLTYAAADKARSEVAVGYGNTNISIGIWRVREGMEEQTCDDQY